MAGVQAGFYMRDLSGAALAADLKEHGHVKLAAIVRGRRLKHRLTDQEELVFVDFARACWEQYGSAIEESERRREVMAAEARMPRRMPMDAAKAAAIRRKGKADAEAERLAYLLAERERQRPPSRARHHYGRSRFASPLYKDDNWNAPADAD